jgi:flagellar basal-body rod protein FlgC
MALFSSATLSSLSAQSHTLAVSANNVANVRSLGVRTDGFVQSEPGYEPQRTVQTTGAGGAVISKAVPISPPSILVYDPKHPESDGAGLVATPNISLEEEFVIQLQAKVAYEANLAALETQKEVLGSLLDVAS